MPLKLRYDVFGAETLGDAKFSGKYEFPEAPGVRIDDLPARVVPFDRIGCGLKPGDWLHFYVHDIGRELRSNLSIDEGKTNSDPSHTNCWNCIQTILDKLARNDNCL